MIRNYALGAALGICALGLMSMHEYAWAILPALAGNIVLWQVLKRVK